MPRPTVIARPPVQGSNFGLPPGFDTVTSFGTGLIPGNEFDAAGRISVFPDPVTLTKSSAVAVADVSVPSNSVVGGELFYTIKATDGTDYQVLRGHIPFSAVNKAGTLTATAGTAVEITSLSTGTFTNTVTIVTGTNKVTLKLNAVPSITPTTLSALCTVFVDGGTGSVNDL